MLNEPTIAVILVLIAVMSVAALICYREMKKGGCSGCAKCKCKR
jgi:hypothetical protein